MVIWMVLLLLCVTIGSLVAVSILRPVAPQARQQDYHTRSLASALVAIDRDQAGGVLDAAQATRWQRAIARRFIARAQHTQDSCAQHPPDIRQTRRSACIWGSACALFCLIMVAGLYAFLGSPAYSDQTLEQRLRQLRQVSNLEALDEQEMLALLEARLRAVPEDGQGWRMVASMYQERGEMSKALVAYDNALKHGKYTHTQRADIATHRIATALRLNQGRVTRKMRVALDHILQVIPDNAKASYMRAIGIEQHESRASARRAWQEFVTRYARIDTPLLQIAREKLALLQSPDAVSTATASGDPTPQQIDVAAPSGSIERQAMIDAMVARLAAKLARNPDDLPGWERLIRAYLVLEDTVAAAEAMERAKTYYADQQQAVARLTALETLFDQDKE